jgi:hypothetical protein
MRRAFRIVAGVLGVAVIGLSLPFAITAFLDDAESIHRLHFLAGVFASGLLLGGSLLICAWRPESIGPFWVAVSTGVASTIAGSISGDFISGGWFTAPISLVILIALHPARSSLLRIDGIDVATAFLGLVALVPAVAYALTQAELQRNGVTSDPHVEFHHYSGMASYALSLPLAAFAAALRVPGRRMAGTIVGVTGTGLGLASLLLSDYPGAFDPLWSWLTLAWGLAVLALAQLGGRRETLEPA